MAHWQHFYNVEKTDAYFVSRKSGGKWFFLHVCVCCRRRSTCSGDNIDRKRWMCGCLGMHSLIVHVQGVASVTAKRSDDALLFGLVLGVDESFNLFLVCSSRIGVGWGNQHVHHDKIRRVETRFTLDASK